MGGATPAGGAGDSAAVKVRDCVERICGAEALRVKIVGMRFTTCVTLALFAAIGEPPAS